MTSCIKYEYVVPVWAVGYIVEGGLYFPLYDDELDKVNALLSMVEEDHGSGQWDYAEKIYYSKTNDVDRVPGNVVSLIYTVYD